MASRIENPNQFGLLSLIRKLVIDEDRALPLGYKEHSIILWSDLILLHTEGRLRNLEQCFHTLHDIDYYIFVVTFILGIADGTQNSLGYIVVEDGFSEDLN